MPGSRSALVGVLRVLVTLINLGVELSQDLVQILSRLVPSLLVFLISSRLLALGLLDQRIDIVSQLF
ncbi:Uncharacterised protein [Mycobacteroides abscessus subsp. massiliense]|nr:Uncharacterised protein [Mycobacteroides abscessus subsp. massiliense]